MKKLVSLTNHVRYVNDTSNFRDIIENELLNSPFFEYAWGKKDKDRVHKLLQDAIIKPYPPGHCVSADIARLIGYIPDEFYVVNIVNYDYNGFYKLCSNNWPDKIYFAIRANKMTMIKVEIRDYGMRPIIEILNTIDLKKAMPVLK